MDGVISHAIAFLIGTATGAAATYYADKYTDQRRRKESEKQEDHLFSKMTERMPDLLTEIKNDLSASGQEMWREFYVFRKDAHVNISGNFFYYEDDGQNSYFNKVRILEEHGYVIDITQRDVWKFRMGARFVERLERWKPAK